jgi:hypothetical protein
MRKTLFLAVGALVAASFWACVGSDPSTTPTAQGAAFGACFSNNTCNPGLTCDLGSETCQVPGDASSGSDASTTTTDSGTTTDDGGALVCDFTTSSYPCKAVPQTVACYETNGTVQCTASSCGPTDSWWTCFSPNQCGTGLSCCLPIAGNSLAVGKTCAEGTLTIPDSGLGAMCGSSTTGCPPTDYQLCQINTQCPTGQRCNLAKVLSGIAALQAPDGPDSSTEIGVCVPL